MFGGVFEHSPWISGAVWDSGLARRHDTAAGLHQSFREVIRQSDREEKLALLLAHPELAVGIASDEQLTKSSQREQRGAGLDRCSPDEFSEFRKLNAAYREKFGFPFIMAVRESTRGEILEAFAARVENNYDAEFETALQEIHKIARLRLAALEESA